MCDRVALVTHNRCAGHSVKPKLPTIQLIKSAQLKHTVSVRPGLDDKHLWAYNAEGTEPSNGTKLHTTRSL